MSFAWGSEHQTQFRQFLAANTFTSEVVQGTSSVPSDSGLEKRKRSPMQDDVGTASAGPSSSSSIRTGEESLRPKRTKKAVTVKTPNLYESSEALLNALQTAFKDSDNVVFAGSFLVSNNPPLPDKQRVQAHKPQAKARVSAAGESLAKARYPCRSRLFISSREWNSFGQSLVTIRMHHHFSHEPYDSASRAPVPTPVNPPWGDPAWPGVPPGTQTFHPDLTSHHQHSYDSYDGSSNHSSITAVDNGSSMEWEDVSDVEDPVALNGGVNEDSEPDEAPLHTTTSPPIPHTYIPSNAADTDTPIPSHTPSIAESPPIPDNLSSIASLETEIFQSRMRQHIRNIRDFCDGLEYQVQFNDFRMLQELETEGASFLRFVHACLQKEGRLDITTNGNGFS
uniref:Uncharacterized protein n=1 Tax=Moniliophthora roreri TaxID=221103 RepID=A0A0W0F7I0_MONRR